MAAYAGTSTLLAWLFRPRPRRAATAAPLRRFRQAPARVALPAHGAASFRPSSPRILAADAVLMAGSKCDKYPLPAAPTCSVWPESEARP